MSRPNIAFSVRASSGTISGWMGSAMMTGWWLVLLGGGDFWAESSIFSEVKWLSESKLVPHVFFSRDFSGTSIQSCGAQF